MNYIISSAVGLKICAITSGIKKYKSIIKKKKKKHKRIVLLAKTKSNTMEVLVSIALIDSDEIVIVGGVLKEYNNMKEANKNPNNR